MTDWTTTPLTTIALATTGIDPASSELCGFAIATTTSDGTISARRYSPVRTKHPIPADAARIHGVTDAVGRWGLTPAEAAAEIRSVLASATTPLVAYNAPWTIATLAGHLNRHGLALPEISAPLLDPFVLDKKNQARAAAGNRTLAAVRQRWNLAALNYGPATVNALGAAELTHTLVTTIPQFRTLDPTALSERCQTWYYEAEEDFRDYLRSVGKTPQREITPWPTTTPQAA